MTQEAAFLQLRFVTFYISLAYMFAFPNHVPELALLSSYRILIAFVFVFFKLLPIVPFISYTL